MHTLVSPDQRDPSIKFRQFISLQNHRHYQRLRINPGTTLQSVVHTSHCDPSQIRFQIRIASLVRSIRDFRGRIWWSERIQDEEDGWSQIPANRLLCRRVSRQRCGGRRRCAGHLAQTRTKTAAKPRHESPSKIVAGRKQPTLAKKEESSAFAPGTRVLALVASRPSPERLAYLFLLLLDLFLRVIFLFLFLFLSLFHSFVSSSTDSRFSSLAR